MSNLSVEKRYILKDIHEGVYCCGDRWDESVLLSKKFKSLEELKDRMSETYGVYEIKEVYIVKFN